MKYLILSNQMRSMSIFWRILLKKIISRGHQAFCCAPEGDEEAERILTATGARIVNCPLDRKGLNPLQDFFYYNRLKKIFLSVKPDILFASTIKPVIYGCSAAHVTAVPGIFATITGLGYVFEKDSFLKKLLFQTAKRMYAHSLAHASGVFFQNRDDEEVFVKNHILPQSARIFFAKGTGVDTEYFQPGPFPPLPPEGPVIFLLIGRLLEAKGIEEYAKAAKLLSSTGASFRFRILGIPETGRGSLPLEKIKEWEDSDLIEYLGQTRDVRPFIANSHVAVLPSWREGVPTSLMEAMAMGRPCLATNVPGCREVVKEGINGFLVQPRNPEALAKTAEKFLEKPELIAKMGAASRKMAVDDFDAHKVADKILADITQAMNAEHGMREENHD